MEYDDDAAGGDSSTGGMRGLDDMPGLFGIGWPFLLIIAVFVINFGYCAYKQYFPEPAEDEVAPAPAAGGGGEPGRAPPPTP